MAQHGWHSLQQVGYAADHFTRCSGDAFKVWRRDWWTQRSCQAGARVNDYMTNMNTTEFLRAVDHAAGMNDRWLFLAAFCLLLLLCGVVIYWLVGHLQAVLSDYKTSRETHQVALEQIINTQNETALKLAVCIDRNTVALQECNFQLRRLQKNKE